MRRNDVPAVTRGPRAAAFAALLPRLRELTLDEGASCIGGFNDDLARALAASAPGLRRLCVSFPDDYSLAAELFTDEGLIRLAEGCPQLQSLSLRHCSHVTDRSLYSLAANCRQLAELRVGGYHERITDSGLGILFDACGDRLKVVRLSGKLVKATDGSVEVLAKRCGGLEELKLSRSAGDAALRALACGACRATLRDLELHRCSATTREVAAALLLACPALQRCTLPAHFGPTWVSQALAAGGRRADVRASDAGVDPKGCSSHSSPLLRVSFQ